MELSTWRVPFGPIASQADGKGFLDLNTPQLKIRSCYLVKQIKIQFILISMSTVSKLMTADMKKFPFPHLKDLVYEHLLPISIVTQLCIQPNPTQPNCPLVVHVLFWSSYFREAWPSKWLVHVMWKIESFVCFYFVGERLVSNQCKVHLVTHFQEYFLLELLLDWKECTVLIQNQFSCKIK
jgi:hypothetical protein